MSKTGSYIGGHTILGPRSSWFSKSRRKKTKKSKKSKKPLAGSAGSSKSAIARKGEGTGLAKTSLTMEQDSKRCSEAVQARTKAPMRQAIAALRKRLEEGRAQFAEVQAQRRRAEKAARIRVARARQAKRKRMR